MSNGNVEMSGSSVNVGVQIDCGEKCRIQHDPLHTGSGLARIAPLFFGHIRSFFFFASTFQELGGSRSGYSLKDQLKVNPEFAESKNGSPTSKKPSPSPSFDDLDKVIKKMKHDWGVRSYNTLN